MTGISTTENFNLLRVCVLIPTYNNAATLAKVIEDVAIYTKHIVVVNDGSTDNSKAIAESFPFVKLLSYDTNKGKGWALRKGFEFAVKLGYHFAISIDSDGQHFAKDLPTFIDKLLQEKQAIIIGARNMNQASVPGKSSFGYKFSNFWFKVETGIDSPDTQSGYRLYPILLLKEMRFITTKYEFEIEVIVKAAWKGIQVLAVPVSVYYPPKLERVSHFRPFKDFTRISILNTFLVLITFLYIKPRDFFRSIFQKKKLRQMLNEQLFHSPHTDVVKSFSVAFGLFMGIVPIWGFQLLVGIPLAILFRLNKALFILSANISIPPMIPLIIFCSYKMGSFWMGFNATSIEFNSTITVASVQNNLEQYIYGSITLAILVAVAGGLFTFALLKLFKRKPILT